jgi:hypothetical protein
MEAEAMNLVYILRDLAVPAMAVLIVGLLKWLGPQIQTRVPGFLWPFVALYLARKGTEFCYWLNVPCEGNFINWSDPEAYAIAQGLAIIGVRELAKDIRKVTPAVVEKVQALADRLRTS